MFEYKQNVTALVPVVLVDANTGAPKINVPFSSVQVSVEKADGTVVSVIPGPSDWEEKTTGAFNGSGKYSLRLPSSAFSQLGPIAYAVKVAAADTFLGSAKVVAAEASDLQTQLNSVATQAGLDAVNQNIAMLDARVQIQEQEVERLRNITAGRWKIHSVGPDANRIVYYAEDGVTIVAKFDLKDISGNPTFKSAFERIPVT